MNDFKAVRSSLDISRSLVYYLSMRDPVRYPPGRTAQAVRGLNDTLQGRSSRTVEALLAELDTVCGGWRDYDQDRAMLHQRIRDFQHQKSLLSQAYTKTSDQQYPYELHEGRKIIDQSLYDQAARDGFPAGFFRNSFFHRVTLYCLPDAQDCSASIFDLCTFAICRIRSMVTFEGCSFYSTEFHSCDIHAASFRGATLAHTHFHDSSLVDISFHGARMRSCHVMDCTMEGVNFLNTTLDGCSFDRVTARHIRNLHTADITQGGATAEESKRSRQAVLAALQPQPGHRRETPEKRRGGR